MTNQLEQHTTAASNEPSVLVELRRLLPNRRLRFDEAMRIAERQANRLLELRGGPSVPTRPDVVSGLPRVVIEFDDALRDQAASGASDWDQHRQCWIILINPSEPQTRQRFTVLHEYKHIIDHYHAGLTGLLPRQIYGLEPTEYLAEYFAGCVLMPARLVKAAFYDGIQVPADVAELFDVSVRAAEVRLNQLGLRESSPTEPLTAYRRQRPVSRTYYRLQPARWLATSREEVAV